MLDSSTLLPRPSHEPAERDAAPEAAADAAKGHVIRDTSPNASEVVLELRVRNHPGTMSHVTGLFARRGFNLDAILCVPVGDGATSRMLLLVSDEPRLEQVERQLAKLYDVLEVRHRPDLSGETFQTFAAG
ncbi:ACT domain-containing protein [Opitutus terrae]|uniref:acetolactate synthase n=1 Tax=Opitutus terrae (strain DSM 11246 / JCM 15787 / PB90-1) TaxID=452637 RepID=B1ZN79_OPITP|nr:amino acid-binding ACT domain protein [Opitutus terrae PB90-1]